MLTMKAKDLKNRMDHYFDIEDCKNGQVWLYGFIGSASSITGALAAIHLFII